MDLSGDEFDERLYDRDCGEGAAQRAVDSIRAEREDGGDAAKNADGEHDTDFIDVVARRRSRLWKSRRK